MIIQVCNQNKKKPTICSSSSSNGENHINGTTERREHSPEGNIKIHNNSTLGVVFGRSTRSFSLCWSIMVKSFGIRATLVAAHEFGYELWEEMKEELMLNKKIENIE